MHQSRRSLLARLPPLAGATALVTSPLWALSCQTTPPPTDGAKPPRRVGRLLGRRYESTPWSFSTCSYAIEGPTGLILIDTQFLTSEANAFVDAAEAATNKRVELAVVLHANPDKFNGTAALQARGIRVVTSAQVAALIPSIHRKRVAAFAERYAPDYPLPLPAPASFGDATAELSAGGTTIRAHVMGAGCSEAHVVVTHAAADGLHLFAGDLVANGAHAWLEIGRSDAWLQRVDEMIAIAPAHVHPGRGPSSDATLLASQHAYLTTVRAIVDEVAAVTVKTDANIDGVAVATERIRAAFPKLKFPVFLRIGIPAELARAQRRLMAPAE